MSGLRRCTAPELEPLSIETQWRASPFDNLQAMAAAKIEDALTAHELRWMDVTYHCLLLGELLVDHRSLLVTQCSGVARGTCTTSSPDRSTVRQRDFRRGPRRTSNTSPEISKFAFMIGSGSHDFLWREQPGAVPHPALCPRGRFPTCPNRGPAGASTTLASTHSSKIRPFSPPDAHAP